MYIEYQEDEKIADKYKNMYLRGIEELIDCLEQRTIEKRNIYCKDIMADKEKYRKKFVEFLGWPLTEERKNSPLEVVTQRVVQEKNYIIERMQFTVLNGLKVTGLLFRHKGDEVRPFVIAQHGAAGTPEVIGGLYKTTGNYNDMVERILENGANVFAPQLLLWTKGRQELFDYDRAIIDARLKNVGSSITALEIFVLMRLLDHFEIQKWVGNMGMVGLSYGGFYTQIAAALDIRIKAAISCAYFCDATHHILPDRSWKDIAQCFGEAEVACLVHPRKLFLEMGTEDKLFDYRKSLTEYERAREICNGNTDDWLEFTLFGGGHEFYPEDDHIKKLLEYLRGE